MYMFLIRLDVGLLRGECVSNCYSIVLASVKRGKLQHFDVVRALKCFLSNCSKCLAT